MKRFIAFFIICSFLTAAIFYNQPKRYPDANYRLTILKYMATAGRDSVFTLSFDSLKQYLRNQGFSDTLSLIDTLAALKIRTSTQIHDSLGQAIVVIPNDIKIKGNDLTFGNGASISNASADTARVTETAIKIEGKLVNFNDYVSHSIATNTILGITAGEKLTSGFSNTFTGEQAGKKVTTGYVNSIYGAEAGKSLTTGFHNNLVGYYAGPRITTGKYNNFFGSETGSRLTTGEHNTIMGHHAMLGTLGDAGTASYNTAIGANSCYKVATGGYNATLGFRAMGSGDGNCNTMLGSYTGYGNPGNIGDRNVFIGYRAGSGCLTASDSLIIASDNAEIFKGSFADSSLIATGKFTIEGDKLAFGSGASITNPSSGILSLNSGIVSISSLTVNGIISYKKPFGKFYRIYTQTPANPDAWENIRWNEKHAETTSHFTATADSQGVIISKAGIYAVRCVSKMLWTGSAATTVSSYFRLWQGKGAAITKELRTSQHTSIKEKNTSNANDEFFWGSRYFAAGDTVYAQWRTSNVGNLIQGSAIFANPTSASIVIEYIKER